MSNNYNLFFMKRQIIYTYCLAIACLFAACDAPDDNPCDVDFDQKAMFQNYTNQLIIPVFTELKTAVDLMETTTNDFVTAPDANNLSDLQNAWFNAYKVWQKAAPYNFGPAESVFLRNSVNNFPLNIDDVNANIQNNTADFSSPDAFDKGFPALDYLLYGIAADNAAILEKYTTNTDASKYTDYLSKVVIDIKSRVDHTYNEWLMGGYDNTFNENIGTAAGSSLSLLVNQLNQNYELIKRDKIGIPSGVLTLGNTNADLVEAYFSGRSLELAKIALEAAENMYLGQAKTDENQIGLDDYLQAINEEGKTLDSNIQAQFTAAKSSLNTLSDPLSNDVTNNNSAVITTYNELSKILVNIKTNMPSLMCISITYIDNASDSD